MNAFDPSVLVTAFLAGLLGSGHCFGMCGGIAGSLGALSGGAGKRSLALPALLAYRGEAVHEILHIYLLDYIPFIILLWGLFTISGGIGMTRCCTSSTRCWILVIRRSAWGLRLR